MKLTSIKGNKEGSFSPCLRALLVAVTFAAVFGLCFLYAQHRRDARKDRMHSYLPAKDYETFHTMEPSSSPSMMPSLHPSGIPSSTPSYGPSLIPSMAPSHKPTTDPSTQPSSLPTQPEDTVSTFYVIGDVPYYPYQEKELNTQLKNLPEDAEFLVHVGDLRKADKHIRAICRQEEYRKVEQILRQSHAPVFVILGDNDWNDCRNMDEAREFWKNEFDEYDKRHWNHTFQVERQPGRNDNFAFVHKKTLFVGLNLVNGEVRDPTEWRTRLADQVKWMRQLVLDYNATQEGVGRVVLFGHANPVAAHNAFFQPLDRFIRDELHHSIPMLYINGDGHRWRYEPSFRKHRSFLRIMVRGGTSEPPLRVEVDSNGENVPPKDAFLYDRRL